MSDIVSIVIPVFNRGGLLREAALSALEARLRAPETRVRRALSGELPTLLSCGKLDRHRAFR